MPFGAFPANSDSRILPEQTNVKVSEKDTTGHAKTAHSDEGTEQE
jgi:hypothetical protein